MNEFFCQTRIVTGPDAMQVLPGLQSRRLLVVTDPFFAENGTAERIAGLSGAAQTRIFDRVEPDPTVTLAAEGAATLRRFQPDTVVALGGGSAMDCAKAMCFFSGSRPQLVAIPTTSGSGSEVTDFAVLTHEGVKHPLVDEALRPQLAILDSTLVAQLPPRLVAEGGFDLLSHALEAYVATGASPCTDALALEAFRRAMELLPASFRGDAAAREALHGGATMAGLAFSRAGLGLCHALSHALGGEFHVPHGCLNAILLPGVIACNAAAAAPRYGRLARQTGLSTGGDAVALRALKNALIQLRRALSLPQNLSQAGISPLQLREMLDKLVAAALADPCCATNPVPPTRELARQVLLEAAGHG